jgi:TonB family protein
VKQKIGRLSIILPLLVGCGGTHETTVPTESVELLSMAPLPRVVLATYQSGIRLNVLMHIREDGTVEHVKMLGSSGDEEWDSLAMQSMKQWRYSPYRRAGVPVDIWFRQVVVVQIQEPVVLTIGEIVCSSLDEADSLHVLLDAGTGPDSLFRRTLRTFDIVRYPQNVREALKRLDPGDYTSPLRRGEEYVIYKRFDKNTLER